MKRVIARKIDVVKVMNVLLKFLEANVEFVNFEGELNPTEDKLYIVEHTKDSKEPEGKDVNVDKELVDYINNLINKDNGQDS